MTFHSHRADEKRRPTIQRRCDNGGYAWEAHQQLTLLVHFSGDPSVQALLRVHRVAKGIRGVADAIELGHCTRRPRDPRPLPD
jgi:hypothetical protein